MADKFPALRMAMKVYEEVDRPRLDRQWADAMNAEQFNAWQASEKEAVGTRGQVLVK